MKYQIYNQDVCQWAKEYKGEKFHALFCDAPYHLSQSNTEELGKFSYNENVKILRKRRSTGFMGMKWDGGDIAMNPETWRALAEHLYPGAFLFVYAGTMNDDLISYAMRQAGLEKFHTMRGWVFSSGFPKSTRIDTAIDRAAGAERKVGEKIKKPAGNSGSTIFGEPTNGKLKNVSITIPNTSLAKAWSGHRYGKQSLKPSLETVLIFIKPYEGRPIDSITKNGAGALNIEAGRISCNTRPLRENDTYRLGDSIFPTGLNGSRAAGETNLGRWPSNFLLTHSISCVQLDSADWQCVEQCPVRKLGEQSIEMGIHSAGSERERKIIEKKNSGVYDLGIKEYTNESRFGDTGTASRFFHNASWQLEILEQIERADEVQYCAKAGRAERELGLNEEFMKLRDDLSEDEKLYVINELKTLGVSILHGRNFSVDQSPTDE